MEEIYIYSSSDDSDNIPSTEKEQKEEQEVLNTLDSVIKATHTESNPKVRNKVSDTNRFKSYLKSNTTPTRTIRGHLELNRYSEQGCRQPYRIGYTKIVSKPPFETATAQTPKITRGKKGRGKAKQLGDQECLVCHKYVHYMKDHLRKTHNLEDRDRRFLLSYYRTRKVSVPVFECKICVVRCCNPWRDHKGESHEFIRIRDPTLITTFPTCIMKLVQKSTAAGRKAVEIIDSYDENLTGGLTSVIRTLVSQLMFYTENFQQPRKLRAFVSDWKSRGGNHKPYKSVTILKHIGEIKRFVQYVVLYHNSILKGRDVQWQAAIREVSKDYTNPAGKEQRLASIALFEKVPTFSNLQSMRAKVSKALTNDLDECCLNYAEMLGFNFFMLQSALNVRPGPLLSNTVDEYKRMDPTKLYPRTDHKTGNKFTVAVQIRNKYRPWLDAMIERFESEYDKKAVLLFGNTFSEHNTVIARIINQSLDNHFGIEGKNYGLTSIRKVWETAKAKDESIKNLCARAHTSQSGHSEATARKFYEKPPDVMEYRDLLNMYHDALEGDRETQNHDATVVPVSNPVAILDSSIGSDKYMDQAVDTTANKNNKFPALRLERPLRNSSNAVYYESDQNSGDSVTDKEYEIPVQDEINLSSMFCDVSFSLNELNTSSITQYDSEIECSMSKKTLRSQFVSSLKPYHMKYFSALDIQVLDSFHDLQCHPTRDMVKQKYSLFAKPDEIDPIAMNRVYKKIERAWSKYLA